MAYTQSQLEQLERAIATGARSITVDGKATTFRSLAEMEGLRAAMAAELAGTTAPSAVRTTFAKGFGS